MDDKVKDYIVDLVCATREPESLQDPGEGVHPARRVAAGHDLPDAGGQGLRLPQGPRLCHAAGRQEHRHGRAAPPGVITYEAEAEEKTSETVIQKIFDELPVP